MPIRISIQTWLALLALALAVYAAIPLLPVVGSVVTLLFLTALLVLLINPLAGLLERRGIKRRLTVAGILLLVVVVALLVVLAIVPVLANSLGGLSDHLEQSNPSLQAGITGATGAVALGYLIASAVGFVASLLQQAADASASLLEQLGGLFFALFVMMMLLFTFVGDPRVGRRMMTLFVPARHHTWLTTLLPRVSNGLSRWFLAQALISIFYVITYSLTNILLGVPYAWTIGTIAGLLEFIPYLGGIVGMILSVLAAATVSPTTAILVLLVQAVLGSFVAYFLMPYLYARAIEVPAAAVLFGLFVGGQIGGFLTALITVPVITIIVIVMRTLRPDVDPTQESPTAAASVNETTDR
ncbi:MAG TPA: AI-2E family transporter [Roseiflexaceae bacterium]|nr:AI-2E family transporter [Roseiflexaceae bacterium]